MIPADRRTLTAAETGAQRRGPTLVPGAAAFIGNHVAERLLEQGWPVLRCDNPSPFTMYGPWGRPGAHSAIPLEEEIRRFVAWYQS